MAAKTLKLPRTRPDHHAAPIEVASITAVGDTGLVTVHASDGTLEVRVAEIPGYRPTAGDRVLVARTAGEEAYVVAVVEAAQKPAIVLPDGSRAEVVEGALELRDGGGRLLVRYADGTAEVSAPSRDLKLSAPQGAVVIEAATDVSIEGARDVAQRAGRRLEVKTDRLHVDARHARVAAGEGTLLARSLATTAEAIAVNVERYELTATRIVEKAKDTFRDVSDLLQQRIGRARVLVDDAYALYSRRTVLDSKEETTVDGKKILIG